MKKGNFLIVTGLLLIAAALFLTGYNVWDNQRAGMETNSTLSQLLVLIDDDPVPPQGRVVGTGDDALSDEIEYPRYKLDPNTEMPTAKVEGKEYIGVLAIPALDLELPVHRDWDNANLKTAPCHYYGSAYLDNLVICAHNYNNHFGRLKNLSYGETITFTDISGNVFTYQIIEIETLQPMATYEMTTGDWDLTLFTCTIGGATRVTVRCERVENEIDTAFIS